MNRWLAEHEEVEVVQVLQTETGPTDASLGAVTITILYRISEVYEEIEEVLTASEGLVTDEEAPATDGRERLVSLPETAN